MRKPLQIIEIFSDHDLEWLGCCGKKRAIPAGALVIEAGKPINTVCILMDGKLSVRTPGGPGLDLATLYPGEIAGEISLVDSRPSAADLIAVEASEVLELEADALRSRFEHEVGFAARFYRAVATCLADRMRTTVGRLNYGPSATDLGTEELQDADLDRASNAGNEFRRMLQKLQPN
jgi:CRP/FNR family cyclic AMP-dependent transcriptional regulator